MNNLSPFTIKRAGQEHLDVLVDFNLRLGQETENRRLDADVMRRSMQAILQDERKGVYLIAFDGDKPVGQIMYVYEWSTWRNANFMWLTDLYVLPEYRKRGVFKALCGYVMDFYNQQPDVIGLRFYVDKSNTSVVSIYQKVGWKESNYNLWEIKKDGCL